MPAGWWNSRNGERHKAAVHPGYPSGWPRARGPGKALAAILHRQFSRAFPQRCPRFSASHRENRPHSQRSSMRRLGRGWLAISLMNSLRCLAVVPFQRSAPPLFALSCRCSGLDMATALAPSAAAAGSLPVSHSPSSTRLAPQAQRRFVAMTPARREVFEKFSAKYHTTTTQLAELASKAKPKLLVLYHHSGNTPEELNAEIRAVYAGHFIVSRDLDVY